jgi:predicted GNAT family N-acyltransferase
MIICQTVSDPDLLDQIFDLRTQVFVKEQGVSPEEEFDAMEKTSIHWAAMMDNLLIATARHRRTDKGLKIERMAVRHDYRRQGVGRILLLHILHTLRPEIAKLRQSAGPHEVLEIYLHAQVQAIPFYLELGFVQVGELFEEAGIAHYRCIDQPSA